MMNENGKSQVPQSDFPPLFLLASRSFAPMTEVRFPGVIFWAVDFLVSDLWVYSLSML
jgi:hypothetical protein